MPQINLQLQQVRVPQSRIGPIQSGIGGGLQSLGQAVTQSAILMNRLGKEAQTEDPSIAMTFAMDSALALREIESTLVNQFPDPLQRQERSPAQAR